MRRFNMGNEGGSKSERAGSDGARDGQESTWPAAVLLAGVIVYLIGLLGSFTFQYWLDNSGLSWGLLMNVVIVTMGVGFAMALFGWDAWRGPADDKPDPLTRIEREIAACARKWRRCGRAWKTAPSSCERWEIRRELPSQRIPGRSSACRKVRWYCSMASPKRPKRRRNRIGSSSETAKRKSTIIGGRLDHEAQTAMAARMQTSRASLNRLLYLRNASVTLQTLQEAAVIVQCSGER